MIDISGNLWDELADVTGITTNGFVKLNGACVMGRGCAMEARDRYRGLDLIIGSLIRSYGNRCFRITPGWFSRPIDRMILTFPVKHRFDQPADLTLIAQSCMEAMEMADKFGWSKIVLPRPGSGNGRLDYFNDVRPVIAPLLDDRFQIITFG